MRIEFIHEGRGLMQLTHGSHFEWQEQLLFISSMASSSSPSSSNFSKYYSQLSSDAQVRYRQKLRLLDNIDNPYRLFEGRKRSAATRDAVLGNCGAPGAETSVQQQVHLSWDSWPT